ncbi:hypothetical protein J8281_11210 [Aquimarina sp. U1-2]|uniref:hypothetical protein n=1 Tax=Aquimarina sp. U1-2 TaxID=2823141 RepID=UPI001AECAEDC|nr:hypothetical protein [Aquimarina sp. U1-2]MBP2832755.1 hypothetical protein [Aquimarina sp. U1-2]
MNFYRFQFVFVLSIIFTTTTIAQQRNYENPWILGVGVNLINDSAQSVGDLFDFKSNYHFQTPISLSLEKRFRNDFGLEGRFNFNRQLEGKQVNSTTLDQDVSVIALDGHLKYYISNLWLNPRRAIYEGYLAAGPGMTFFDSEDVISFNLGAGINWFLSEQTRFNMQAVFKKGISGNPVNSYIQFNFGFIFRLSSSRLCSCI